MPEKNFLKEKLLPVTQGTISAPKIVILAIILKNRTTIFKMAQKWWKHALNSFSGIYSKGKIKHFIPLN